MISPLSNKDFRWIIVSSIPLTPLISDDQTRTLGEDGQHIHTSLNRYYDNVISASSLAKMERSIVSIVILSFLITSTAAVKKLPEHLFVNRVQEKTHSVEENGVETQVTTVKVFWSLYEGGYVYRKKRMGKKITVAMILQNAQDWSAQIIVHQMHWKALWGIPQKK